MRIGQQHHQTINPDPDPACGWHADLQRRNKIFIEHLCFFIPCLTLLHLRLKPFALFLRVIELSKGIGDFPCIDKTFEPFG